jgi:hypothetical protein
MFYATLRRVHRITSSRKSKSFSPLQLICSLLLLSSVALGQDKPEYAVKNIPAGLLENANSVIRNYERVLEIQKPGKAVLSETFVITILNREGAFMCGFGDSYDQFSKVTQLSGNIYDGEGRLIRRTNDKEINDRSLLDENTLADDARSKWISVSESSYPFTVEFREEMVISGYLTLPQWRPLNFYKASLEKSSLTVKHPAELEIKYLLVNCEGAMERKKSEGDREIISWSLTEMHAIKNEPYSKSLGEQLPRILVSSTQFELKNYKGSIESWESFGNFVYRLNENRDLLKKDALPAGFLDASVADKRATAEKLYHYLQDNTRYISIQLGIGGWQSFEASYVNKYKIGDCKALTTYMKGLLKLAGIQSFQVLVNSGDHAEKFPEDFPFNFFDHVILMVPFGQDTTWLECTSGYNPFGYLGSATEGRKGLLLDGASSRLIQLPQSRPSELKLKSDIFLNEDLSVSANSTLTAKGKRAEELWYYLHEGVDKLKEWLLDYARKDVKKIDGIREIKNPTSPNEAGISCTLQLQNTMSKAGNNIMLEVNTLTGIKSVPPGLVKRESNVSNETVVTIMDSTTYHIPDAYNVKITGKDTTMIISDFGECKSSLKYFPEKKQLEYMRLFTLNKFNFPSNKYEDLRKFFTAVHEADQRMIFLEKK